MKTSLVVVALSFVLISATNCQFNLSGSVIPSATAEPTLPSAMKGYELYSWQVAGEWYFSLLQGTNRLKTFQEVTADSIAVKGIDPIMLKLARLRRGEQVFWAMQSIPNLTLLPEGTINQIKEFCAKSGIDLTVSK